MTIDKLIAQIRASIASKLELRKTHTDAIEAVRAACMADSGRTPTDEEATKVRDAQAGQVAVDGEIAALRTQLTEYEAEKARDEAVAGLQREFSQAAPAAPSGPARTGQEPRTYMPHLDSRGERSFFVDAYRAQAGDPSAQSRLARHMDEVRAEGELTERAVTSAGFAGLVVPQYLVDLAALAARNGRPFANAVTRLQLPDQGTVFQIPRGTTGAATAIQATENSSVQSTDEVWANLTLNIATIAGQQDVSRQSLERGTPGLDALIYRDLAGAYAANLDSQIISGTGAGGQLLGVYNTAGITTMTAFVAAATATTFWSKLAGAVNAIEASGTVVAPANLIVMHPRRFSWLLSLVDSQGRPLITPVANGLQVFNGFGVDGVPGAYSGNPQSASTGVDFQGFTVKGYLQGIPVITDANVQTAVGTGPEDIVYVVNTDHLLLFENGDGMPNQLKFEQTLGNQLTVKLVAYNYAAFTAGRYPTASSVIGGNAGAGFGLIAPTF